MRYCAKLMFAGDPVIVTCRSAEPSVALAILICAPDICLISFILLPCLPIMQPIKSLGIVSSWELVGVVASSPIQGTEGKCYASCLQEGQDTTNDILKKETYRKEREKKREKKGAKKNRELTVKQKRKKRMQNSEGWANFK